MDYIELIERVINYIETHLEDDINLDIIAMRENFSIYYFHRIFGALVGESLATYIRKRRLNASVKDITSTTKSLTDIALSYNFGSQSSFIRSFKQQYEVTPSKIRNKSVHLDEVLPPDIVKRSLMNFNGDLVTTFKLRSVGPINLFGIITEVDLALNNHQQVIKENTKAFLNECKDIEIDECYRMFFDCGVKETVFGYFIGVTSDNLENNTDMLRYTIPRLLVAEFNYVGNLLDIGDIITKDLDRWSKIARIQLNTLGISVIQKVNLNDMDDMFILQIPIQEDRNVDN